VKVESTTNPVTARANRSLITSLGFVAALLWAVSPASALVPSTVRVSLSSTGSQLGLYSGTPTISADGRWVTFDAYDPKAVPGDTNNARDVLLRDRVTGETRRISALPNGTEADFQSWGGSMSADGRYVAFVSQARNLAPSTSNLYADVFLYDRLANSLKRMSTSLTGGDGADGSFDPQVSLAAPGGFPVEVDAFDANGQKVTANAVLVADTSFGGNPGPVNAR
jgi:Tol biopolymer transport system component